MGKIGGRPYWAPAISVCLLARRIVNIAKPPGIMEGGRREKRDEEDDIERVHVTLPDGESGSGFSSQATAGLSAPFTLIVQ